MAIDYETLNEEVGSLARRLFAGDTRKQAGFTGALVDICSRAEQKDFLLIHNPGGWGFTRTKDLLQWERSTVEGVSATMAELGYDCSSMQYFRSNHGWREIFRDIREQAHFFEHKSKIMAAELEFVLQHFEHLQVVMIGVSQGAAFTNAVLQHLNGQDRVSSIELGLPFPYKSKRVITERTLALDSNGLMPDALMEWNVPIILKTYLTAPFRWLKYKLQRKHVKFTYCINLPGHDYNWDYPEVHKQIARFFES